MDKDLWEGHSQQREEPQEKHKREQCRGERESCPVRTKCRRREQSGGSSKDLVGGQWWVVVVVGNSLVGIRSLKALNAKPQSLNFFFFLLESLLKVRKQRSNFLKVH